MGVGSRGRGYMKKAVILIIIVLLGVGALAYPSISDYLARKNGSELIQEYTVKLAELDDGTKSRMWAEAEKYNETLTGRPVHDPFIEGTGIAMPEEYRQTLNVDGIMGYVEIPSIDVYLPIYHGTGDNVLNKGAGHLEGSTLPIGGSYRHSVITGHSGLVHAKMFTDLTALTEGDLFYIHVLGETLAYEVDRITITQPHITDELVVFDGKDYCTLLTCTPYGVNTHRLLVRGERVEYNPEIKEAISQTTDSVANNPVVWVAVITAALMFLLIIIAVIVTRKRRRKNMNAQNAFAKLGISKRR